LGKFFPEAVQKYGSGYSGAFVDCDIESGLCADEVAGEVPSVIYYKDGQIEDGYICRKGVSTWVRNIWIKKTGKAPNMKYRKIIIHPIIISYELSILRILYLLINHLYQKTAPD
jgi:hypothetical protein